MSSRTPQTESAPREATGEEKAEAEQLKNEGNQLMRDEKYTEALDCYTKWVHCSFRIIVEDDVLSEVDMMIIAMGIWSSSFSWLFS